MWRENLGTQAGVHLIEVVRLIWGPLDTGFTVEYFGYAYVLLPSSFSKIGFMLWVKLKRCPTSLSIYVYISRFTSISVPFASCCAEEQPARSRHFKNISYQPGTYLELKKTFLKLALFLFSIQPRCPLMNSSVNVLLSRTRFAHFPSYRSKRKAWLPSALPSRVAAHLKNVKLLESLKASLVWCVTSVRGMLLTWSSWG